MILYMNYGLINTEKVKRGGIKKIEKKTITNNVTGSMAEALISNRFQVTPLAEIFFSRMNIAHIQKKIKKEIFIRTNGKYIMRSDQDERDLIAVMQAVYIDDAENLPYDYKAQLKHVNHRVLERIIPDMISAIELQQGYLHTISNPRELLPLPVNVNNTGRKGTLPSYTTTYNW